MTHVLRRYHLDVDLATHDVLAVFADVLAANIEVSALAHGRLVVGRDREFGRVRPGRRHWKCERRQNHGPHRAPLVHYRSPLPRRACDGHEGCSLVAPFIASEPINNIQLRPLSRSQKPDTVAKSRISAACDFKDKQRSKRPSGRSLKRWITRDKFQRRTALPCGKG